MCTLTYHLLICWVTYLCHSDMPLQDVIEDDEIKLDWFFKASLIHDLVSVSVYSSLLLI